MYDAYGLEVLSQPECYRLLRENRVGRFIFVDHMLLVAHPVAYVFDGASVVFQSNGGAKLEVATEHSYAGFEIDYVDPEHGYGWTVIVSGHAEPVTDAYEVTRLKNRLPPPWTNKGRVDIIRMRAEIVQGRRTMPKPSDDAAPRDSGTAPPMRPPRYDPNHGPAFRPG